MINLAISRLACLPVMQYKSVLKNFTAWAKEDKVTFTQLAIVLIQSFSSLQREKQVW